MFTRKYTRPARQPMTPRTEPARATIKRADGPERALVAIPKQAPERSASYREWVATLPCMACKIEGYSQAAHPNQGRGLGQKASDLDCFPLCCARPGHMGHHAEHDLLIGMTLEERRELELRYIAHMRVLAVAAGRKEIAP